MTVIGEVLEETGLATTSSRRCFCYSGLDARGCRITEDRREKGVRLEGRERLVCPVVLISPVCRLRSFAILDIWVYKDDGTAILRDQNISSKRCSRNAEDRWGSFELAYGFARLFWSAMNLVIWSYRTRFNL